MKFILVFFIPLFLLSTVYAQDKIFLRNDSVLTGKIIYVDSLMVKILLAVRPDRPEYIYYKNEITKTDYPSGKEIFFRHKFFERSIGISGAFYNNHSSKTTNPYVDVNYLKINGKYSGLNYQVRNKVLGFKFGIEYGHFNEIKEINKGGHYGYHGYITSINDTTDTDNLHLIISLKVNGTTNRIINPFLSTSFIIQGFSNIYLFCFGLQIKLNKKYFFESEASLGGWSEESNGETHYGNFLTYFSFGVNRILILKYKNGK